VAARHRIGCAAETDADHDLVVAGAGGLVGGAGLVDVDQEDCGRGPVGHREPLGLAGL
jgi:hypothetical protein